MGGSRDQKEKGMRFYIDFDDCLCETARHFTGFVKELFGKSIQYEEMKFFDLKRSFMLTEEQYEHMMIEAHKPEVLLAYEETPGASGTVNSWIDSGHEVFVITGRPYSAYEASRTWLDQHGFERVRLYCLNKYGRDNFYKAGEYGLEIEDYRKMHFDYAVEDSPAAFRFFEHLPELKVLVYDRPWNQDCVFPREGYYRCSGWNMIRDLVEREHA